MKHYSITIEPSNRQIFADPEISFIENLRRNGVYLETSCGGIGTCGKCKVRFIKGRVPVSSSDENLLSETEIAEGWRLACQAVVKTDVTISVPHKHHRSKNGIINNILTGGYRAGYIINPNVKKHYLELKRQTVEKPTGDAELITQALASEMRATLSCCILDYLPRLLREADYKITATVWGDRVIRIEKGDTSKRNFGIAFDIGTTTVVGALMDLNTGQQIAVEPIFNPQRKYGDDVISRIQHCRANKHGVQDLKTTIHKGIEEIIYKLCERTNVRLHEINEIVAVGNPTMAHLFLGLDPSFIGELPYAPVTDDAVRVPPDCKALPFNTAVEVPVNLSGFIGSDIVAGILSLDLIRRKDISLFIDIGTNAEIVLAGKGKLLLTNAAAGPAFEGARIECGTRAIPGAIDRFKLDGDDVSYTTVDHVEANGICGSGLVDILATLLKIGVVDMTGRLLPHNELPENIPPKIRSRVKSRKGKTVFHISDGVYVSEGDIRQVQNAKAAVAAGILIIEKRMGITHEQVDRIFIAGGFGNYVDPASAVAIGLLPKTPLEKITGIGNSALEGAKMYLLSTVVRNDSKAIRDHIELHELSAAPEFMDTYTSQMLFE
mgnify:CR=1 FL=1